MRGRGARRFAEGGRARGLRVGLVAGLVTALLGASGSASAIDFLDGRVQAHGFVEAQIRTLNRDFEEDWDLAQWWNVLNVEIEADILQDPIGPFDLVSSFVRLEVRYDCVWTRACGLARSADVYGDRPERQPARLNDGRRDGFNGNQFTGDVRPWHLADFQDLGFPNRNVPVGSRKPVPFWGIPGFSGFFGIEGPDDGMIGTPENPGQTPALFTFSPLLDDDCLFDVRKTKGAANGVGNQVLPITPKCNIDPIGTLRNKPNPFSPIDMNPTVLGGAGVPPDTSLPFRPVPLFAANGPRAPQGEAQGIFMPNERLAEMLRNDEFDNTDQNFREAELQFNRGASQQDEKELKEAYLDIEMFDSRLWLRLGKQNIVWGKTELFRTTDQFNPQDLGLASLPSLEESRIALWAARAVWSFYEVGPLSDVRLEVAANFDQVEPVDLGRCGEPFSPLPACAKTFGLIAHGLTGIGIAGEVRPPNPWDDTEGIEVGARLEWRWGRFSFSVSDFWGFNDFFFVDRLFDFSRNVDPVTGRLRESMSQGRCVTGTEAACLTPDEALRKHSANQQVFAMVCSTTVGVLPGSDPAACAQNIFGSQALVSGLPIVQAFNSVFAGTKDGQGLGLDGAAVLALQGNFNANTEAALSVFPDIQRRFGGFGQATPLVPLNQDVNDVTPALPVATGTALLNPFLTVEQQALLGCGEFLQTNCDIQGIDLLNTEASVLFQSFSVFEGTFGTFWDTTDASVAQPGTVGFQGGPVGTRNFEGRVVKLPGSRGPGDPGFDPAVDGTVSGKVHPFTGQEFANEMAILSWNFQMGLVAFSSSDDPAEIAADPTLFDPNDAFARDRCSFATTQLCNLVQGLIDLTSTQRSSRRAGGNGNFGRRDFLWTSGGSVVLRFEKRNVLGFSLDWAEDVTKSNWSVESTWINELPFADQDDPDRFTKADTYNLTISVDRPTFVNFLNANRTFFFNSQIFFQWVDGYRESFTSNGPWNILGTFTVATGYFQDRLLPSATFVYDKRSNSGAFLPQITYRFSETFSATFGAAAFMGRFEKKDLELHPVGTNSTRVGPTADNTFVENGLSGIRERDELFLRIRYTF